MGGSSLYEKYVKRYLDLSIALVGIPLFIILYLVIGLAIKLEDGGHVLYRADRIGKDNKLFPMYKFRSMKVDAPNWLNADGSTYNAEEDPRVTKVGRLIRTTSLDEVPQILNVLAGHMSIVGPRPSLAIALGTFEDDELDKMRVRPGITGYVQAYYRNDISNREKRLKDAWYANNVTLRLDARILCRTVVSVFKRDGLYTNSNELDTVHDLTKE